MTLPAKTPSSKITGKHQSVMGATMVQVRPPSSVCNRVVTGRFGWSGAASSTCGGCRSAQPVVLLTKSSCIIFWPCCKKPSRVRSGVMAVQFRPPSAVRWRVPFTGSAAPLSWGWEIQIQPLSASIKSIWPQGFSGVALRQVFPPSLVM